MTEIHVQVETVLWIIGGSVCTALLLAKMVLTAYDDMRRTWRKIVSNRDRGVSRFDS